MDTEINFYPLRSTIRAEFAALINRIENILNKSIIEAEYDFGMPQNCGIPKNIYMNIILWNHAPAAF